MNKETGRIRPLTIVLLLLNAALLIVIIVSATHPEKEERPGITPQPTAEPKEETLSFVIPEEEDLESDPYDPSLITDDDAQEVTYVPDEVLNLQDFDWYHREVSYSGIPDDAVFITDPEGVLGSWKGYVKYDPKNVTGNAGDFLLFVTIDAGQNGIDVICTWYWGHYYKDAEGSYDDSAPSHYYGTFQDGEIHAEGNAEMNIRYFYKWNGSEFAVGTMTSKDGTQAIICLVR